MARETFHSFVDLDNRDVKVQLVSLLGRLTGWWEVTIQPRRNLRSLQQNKFWWSCRVEPLFQFLREQDYAIASAKVAHEMLKDKLLRASAMNPHTGQVIEWTRSTTDLDTAEMADLIDRAGVYLSDEFRIITPEMDQAWRETAGAA
jgi:hypothetical protein